MYYEKHSASSGPGGKPGPSSSSSSHVMNNGNGGIFSRGMQIVVASNSSSSASTHTNTTSLPTPATSTSSSPSSRFPVAAASHHQQQPSRTHVTSTDGGCLRAERTSLKYKGIADAARQIYAAEGARGFFRGMLPRLLVHTPSVAISWTTYETIKEMLKTYL